MTNQTQHTHGWEAVTPKFHPPSDYSVRMDMITKSIIDIADRAEDRGFWLDDELDELQTLRQEMQVLNSAWSDPALAARDRLAEVDA